jgi:hypothetical protein
VKHEALDADQLEAAIEAIAGGQPSAAVLAGLPADLRDLVETGLELRAARGSGGDLPGTTFLLGLEDQLRTDLRLLRPGSGHAPVARPAWLDPRWLLGLALGGLLVLGLLGGAAQRAQPGEPLYALARGLEEARATLSLNPVAKAGLALDRAWKRMNELTAFLGRDGRSTGALAAQLGEIGSSYALALDLVAEADDSRLGLRALGEVDAAIESLRELAHGATLDEREALLASLRDLEQLRQRLALVLPPELVQIREEPPVSGILPAESATPSPSESAPEATATELPATQPASASPTTIAPPASATAIPSPTELPATATDLPPTRERSRTDTPVPPPSKTPEPPRKKTETPTSEPPWPTPPPPSPTPGSNVTSLPPAPEPSPTPESFGAGRTGPEPVKGH